MANILYKKLKRQYTDNGVSWIDMNVYKVGEVLEDPSNCQSENTKQCRWVELDESEGYICDTETYTKYKIQLKECSTDGIVWTRTGERRQGNIIDFLSPDCGYNGESNCEGGVHEYYNSIIEPKIVYRYGNIFLLNPDLIVNYDNKTTFDIKEYFTTNINCYSAHDIITFNWEYNNSYNLAKSFLIHINTWECDETQGKPRHIIGTWDFNSNNFIQLLTMDECVKFYQYKNDSIILCDCTIYNTWVYYEITSDYGINILTEEEFENLTTIEVGSAYYYTDKDKTYYDVLVYDGLMGYSGGTLYYNGEVYENYTLMNYYNDYAFFHTEDKLIVISKNGDYMEYTIDFPTSSSPFGSGLVNYYIDGKYYISNANTKQSENTELYVFDNGTLTKEVFPNGYLTEGNYSLPYLYTNPIFKLGVATSDGETLHYGNAVDTYGDSSFNQYEINISGREYFTIDGEYYEGYDSFFKFLYKNGYITKELTEDEESDVLMATIFIDNLREDILYPTIGLICFEALAEYIKYVFDRYKEILDELGNTSGDTGTTEECRWVELDLSDGYTCVGYSKYTLEVEECSTDGITWTRTGNRREGVLVESNSVDCGYSGNTSGDTGNTGTTVENNLVFEFSGNSLKYKLNHTSYTASTSPYSKYISYMLTSCASTFMDSKLTNLIEFPDTSNVTNMIDMFYNCDNLASLDLSNFDTSNVTDMMGMFGDCSSLSSLNLSSFDTSNVFDMTRMFYNCPSLTSLDLSNFNTSKVTTMQHMFKGCSGLTSLDLSNFDTSNVTNMGDIFSGCTSLTSLDLSNWNTSKITYMTDIFSYCTSLTSLDVSSFDTSNVIEMGNMFKGCSSLTSLDLSNFDTNNVINMGNMFKGCSSLTSLDLSSFDTSNLKHIDSMFEGCTSLTSLDLSNWDTSDVINASSVFKDCTSLSTVTVANCSESTKQFILDRLNEYYTATLNGDIITIQHSTSGDTGNTGTTTEGNLIFEFSGDSLRYSLNVTTYTATTSPYSTTLQELGIDNLTRCSNTFSSTNLTNLIEFPDTSNVTTMYNMFSFCKKLTSLDLSSFNTSNVIDISFMFEYCSGLTSLNLSNWDTSNVSDMSSMFYRCTSLSSLDLSNFDTSNVTDMGGMFGDCSSLSSLNLSNWNTSNVSGMTQMFINCSGLTSLDVSNFNTSNVTKMGFMFADCTNLTSLDLSSFNTSNVTDMSSIFRDCSGLTSLNLSNWDTSNVTSMSKIFNGCTSLTSLDLSNWNTSKVTTMTYMFADCNSLTTVTVANCSDTTKQFILDRVNEYFTATLDGDIITVSH